MPHLTLRHFGREPISPTSVRLPSTLKKQLSERAKLRRQPLSSLIVFVLEQWLAMQEANHAIRQSNSDRVKDR